MMTTAPQRTETERWRTEESLPAAAPAGNIPMALGQLETRLPCRRCLCRLGRGAENQQTGGSHMR
jgi:hypothetical protein